MNITDTSNQDFLGTIHGLIHTSAAHTMLVLWY